MPSWSPLARANIPKMRAASCAAMPTPLSSTLTTQPSWPACAETSRAAGARRELHGVRDEGLQQAAELARVAADLGELEDLERRAGLVEPGPQVLGDLRLFGVETRNKRFEEISP